MEWLPQRRGVNEPYLLHDRDTPRDLYRNNFPAVARQTQTFLPMGGGVPRTCKGDRSGGTGLVITLRWGDHRGVSLDSRYWGFIPQEI